MIQVQVSVNSSQELEAEKSRLVREGYSFIECNSFKSVEEWVFRKGTHTVAILA